MCDPDTPYPDEPPYPDGPDVPPDPEEIEPFDPDCNPPMMDLRS